MTDFSTSHSHLFTVRLWREEGSAGEIEYRGQVQHVLSGQLRHFREWKTLIDFCRARFEDSPPEMDVSGQDEENNDDSKSSMSQKTDLASEKGVDDEGTSVS